MNDIVTELYSKYMEEIAFETAKRKKFRELNKKILEVLTAQKKLPNEVQEAIEKYEELNAAINSIFSEEAFRMDFRLGAGLKRN